MNDDPHLRAGLNVYRGRIAHPAVATALGEPYWDPQRLKQPARSARKEAGAKREPAGPARPKGGSQG
jgi:hypothetical protein